ncbi:MAG: CHASE2 domain-containing protein [Deltaproteobacteria bacterium]|nr:CHASE2 domain-containing protein [Deltaproteobacteria bacterium]
MSRSLKSVVISGLFLSVIASLVYVFYATELRSRTEDELYDLRTRLAPSLRPKNPVLLITIDDGEPQTSLALGSMPWQARPIQSLEAEKVINLTERLLNSKARMIGVILPPQFVSYDDPHLDKLAALAKGDERIFIGAFGHSKIADDESGRASRLLLTAADSLYRADIKRDFRRETIRKLLVREPDDYPHIVYSMAERFKSGATANKDAQQTVLSPNRVNHSGDPLVIELNYAHKDELIQLTASSVISNPEHVDLTDSVILVGYTGFRPFTFDSREATYVNTPWQPEGADLSSGIPVLHLAAIGLINLIDDTHLKRASNWVNLTQTVCLSLLALVAWSFEIRTASLIFVCSWGLLLIVHAALFSYLNLHIPLADTALWSALATVCGAFWRLRADIQQRAGKLEKLSSDAALAEIQDKFLSRFAAELLQLNDQLLTILKSMSSPMTGTAARALEKATSSAVELQDYLVGMRHVGYLNRMDNVKPTMSDVTIGEVIVEVLRLFELRSQEAQVSFLVSLTPDAEARGDRTLIAQILYNLVSNAIKYSPRGGEIEVEAVRQKSQIIMRVSDHGPGIDAEFHERIFEKFYRIKDEIVYKSKGHGLGLYLSRYFARQMNGDIEVVSSPGSGATFILRLLASKKGRG